LKEVVVERIVSTRRKTICIIHIMIMGHGGGSGGGNRNVSPRNVGQPGGRQAIGSIEDGCFGGRWNNCRR
jgi:hypothetical protein